MTTPRTTAYGGRWGILASVLFFLVLLPKERARYGGLRWAKWLNLGLSAAWCVYIGLFFFSDMLPSLGVYAQQWKTKGNGFLLNFTVSARVHAGGKARRLHRGEGGGIDPVPGVTRASPATAWRRRTRSPISSSLWTSSSPDLTQFETLTLTGDPTPLLPRSDGEHHQGQHVLPGHRRRHRRGGVRGAHRQHHGFSALGHRGLPAVSTENTPSLAQLASALDIRSSAYHPYLSSGWYRTTAYRHLGFDSQYYQGLVVDGEDITTEYSSDDLVRGYVSDSADFSRIYALTDAAKENGQDCFVFNVTMQNHSGYNKESTNLNRSVSLDGEYTGNGYDSTTSQYLALASATDSALEELIEHYSQVEESTVILFFGDHQPALSNDLYRDIYGKAPG